MNFIGLIIAISWNNSYESTRKYLNAEWNLIELSIKSKSKNKYYPASPIIVRMINYRFDEYPYLKVYFNDLDKELN